MIDAWIFVYIYIYETNLTFVCSIMQFIAHPTTIDMLNIEDQGQSRVNALFPDSIRAIICGPSNGGKTNSLVSLLLSENGPSFRNVYVYSKSLFQPKYQFLEKVFSGMKEIGYHTFSNNADVLSPEETEPNSVCIFDDISCEKQDVVKNFFSMGRHRNLNVFYLCQSYSQIPKFLIRDNTNFLMVFKQDELNLRNIHRSHVNSDMTFEKFLELCRICWSENFGFLLIDKESDVSDGRYRKGFNMFAVL